MCSPTLPDPYHIASYCTYMAHTLELTNDNRIVGQNYPRLNHPASPVTQQPASWYICQFRAPRPVIYPTVYDITIPSELWLAEFFPVCLVIEKNRTDWGACCFVYAAADLMALILSHPTHGGHLASCPNTQIPTIRRLHLRTSAFRRM